MGVTIRTTDLDRRNISRIGPSFPCHRDPYSGGRKGWGRVVFRLVKGPTDIKTNDKGSRSTSKKGDLS